MQQGLVRRILLVVAVGLLATVALLVFRPPSDAPRPTADPVGHWRELPSPPLSPRASPLVYWTGRETLVVGGDRRPCAPSVSCDSVDVDVNGPGHVRMTRDGAAYDPQSHTWRPIADAPVFLDADDLAAVAGHHLLVLTNEGWFDYDVRADTWSRFRSHWDHRRSGLSAIGSQVFGVGWSGRVLAYDVRSGRWQGYPRDDLRPRLSGPVTATPSGPVLSGRDVSEPADIHYGNRMLVDVWTGRAWRRLPRTGQHASGFAWTGSRLVNAETGVQDHGDEYAFDPVPQGGIVDLGTGAWTGLPSALTHPTEGGWDVGGSGWVDQPGAGDWFLTSGLVYNARTGAVWPLPRPPGAAAQEATGAWMRGRLVVVGGGDFTGQQAARLSNRAWIYTP